MVPKWQIKKNRLDLEYKSESQKSYIFLTFGTISVLGMLAAMVLQKQYLVGAVLTFLIFTAAMAFYRKTQKRMKKILNKIDKL